MHSRAIRLVAVASVFASLSALTARARSLTFEDRVQAQESIERVYYSHQLGATKPFVQAVPRELLERKVRTYLKQSVALDRFWKTPVTAEMLRREIERMTAGTRMPERLRELTAVLDDDPFLVEECLARPVLVDRLVRNFFDRDQDIHAGARRRAELLRDHLASRKIDPSSDHPLRTVGVFVRTDPQIALGLKAAMRLPRTIEDPPSKVIDLPAAEFDTFVDRLPEKVGTPGSVVEERGQFLIQVALDRQQNASRVASFAIEKRRFEDWWMAIEGDLDENSAEPISRDGEALQFPGSPAGAWGAVGGAPVQTYGVEAAQSLCVPDDTWTPISTTNAPAVRSYHTAIWTGSLMIVWGGITGSSMYTNTGGRYDPALDTWTATSTAGAPTARELHSAVWTGSLMVVWGGHNNVGFGYLNTGGLYDPVSDSWTPTSTINAPVGRSGHAAVWTGSEMLVWGGRKLDPDAYPQRGGRYDPVTDTWRSTAIANAPAGRDVPRGVWTGSRMIVWGGVVYKDPFPNYFNSGGRYDPETDSWTATSLTNAPSGRNKHAAVWSGSEMIIWGGGAFPLAVFNTGGRYEPATDTWIATTTTGAPTAREGPSAVWTGSRLIVWGGSGLTTGGRYDPVADAWLPTSTQNAPEAGSGGPAVWTGSLMLIWGGTGSGGRYALGHGTDDDGDGMSECAGDCNDADALAHPGALERCNGADDDCDGVIDEGAGSPPRLTGMHVLADESTLHWTPMAGSSGYDVVKGDLGLLHASGGNFTTSLLACVENDSLDAVSSDAATPAAGQGFYYISRALGCGQLGTYDDEGPSQQGSRDGEIASSAAACP